MKKRFDSNEAGVFFAATIVLALASWPVSFTLGAYGDVFYTSTLTVWIASAAALFGMLVIGQTQEGERYFSWWGAILLALPSLALTSVLWADAVPWLDDLLNWGILLSLPYIAYILLSVSAPEAMELRNKRLLFWLAAGFILLNALSFAAGLFNSVYLTCDDFINAGDEAPPTCWVPGKGVVQNQGARPD